MEVLKLAVMRRIQDEERSKNSAWLRKALTYDWRVIDVLLKVVEYRYVELKESFLNSYTDEVLFFNIMFYSTQDRYQIVESLVDFASTLMSVEKKMSHEEVLLAEMGVKIIRKIAKKVDISGKYILQLLSDKILISGCSVSQYTGEIFYYLCSCKPGGPINTTLNNSSRVRLS